MENTNVIRSNSISDTILISEAEECKRFSEEQCPIVSVVIFNDKKAEIKRVCKLSVFAGVQEFVVFGLSKYIEQKSFRVSSSNSNCTLLEVSFKRVTEDLKPITKDGQLNVREELETKIKTLECKLCTLNERKNFLGSMANSMFDTTIPIAKEDCLKLLEEEVFEGQLAFFKYYSTTMQPLIEEATEIEEQLTLLKEELQKLNEKYAISSHSKREYSSSEICIHIFSEEELDVEFYFTYTVKGAEWVPQYDIRFSGEENQLELTYYASVTQTTGENWENVNPKPLYLQTINISFSNVKIRKVSLTLRTSKPVLTSAPPSVSLKSYGLSQINQETRRSADLSDGSADSQSIDDITSSVFMIPRPCTVFSSSKPNKLPITIIPLQTHFSYLISPKINQSAYLTAKVINSSQHFTLHSGKANIYIDGAYICNTNIGPVRPNEQFHIYLGTDPYVKVDFKEAKTITNEKSSAIRKLQSATYSYHTIVKNNKKIPIYIKVMDQYPQSTDEKIKIKLIEPANLASNNAIINADHNIEWELQIQPNEKAEIPFSYIIEWPISWELEKNFQF